MPDKKFALIITEGPIPKKSYFLKMTKGPPIESWRMPPYKHVLID